MSVGKPYSHKQRRVVRPGGPCPAYRPRSARDAGQPEDRRANSLALIITTSLLFVLFASALLVGGHAIITPLLRAPAPGGGTNNRGDIVYTMPDGTFCQHMTFDNATGQISAGGIDRCDPSIGGGGGDRAAAFKWGAH